MTTLAERFWAKVVRLGDDECWEWSGSRAHYGHGQFWNGDRAVYAHRFSWELHNGPIPKGDGFHGTCVCHHCDNPPCVNPRHLFLGSHADNLRDAGKKGRMPRGRAHVHNRLTEEQVVEIVLRKEAGESQRSIARSFGLHPSSVNRIFNGTAWAWLVRGETTEGDGMGRQYPNASGGAGCQSCARSSAGVAREGAGSQSGSGFGGPPASPLPDAPEGRSERVSSGRRGDGSSARGDDPWAAGGPPEWASWWRAWAVQAAA